MDNNPDTEQDAGPEQGAKAEGESESFLKSISGHGNVKRTRQIEVLMRRTLASERKEGRQAGISHGVAHTALNGFRAAGIMSTAFPTPYPYEKRRSNQSRPPKERDTYQRLWAPPQAFFARPLHVSLRTRASLTNCAQHIRSTW